MKITVSIFSFNLCSCIKRQPTLRGLEPQGCTVLLGIQGKCEFLISLVFYIWRKIR